MKTKRIVVVEDEPDIFEIMEYNLKREGYEVQGCLDGAEGMEMVRRERPDLVLLDLMLPGMSGLDICRALKTEELTRNIPIVIVTAKNTESDVVLGLGLGADDYIAKPFSPRELIARVQAVLRRGPLQTEQEKDSERINYEGLVVDAGRHQVVVDGEQGTFTATEFRLLHFLMSHPGRVFSRDQLVHNSIGTQAVVLDRNIDVHIRSIRKKIGPYRDLIETVRGVGYRFQE